MSSIAVVVPSWHYWKDPLKLQPLWELYYATVIRELAAGAEVDVIDLRPARARETDFVIPERDVYLYWLMKTADAPEVYGIVASLRRLYPRSVHIAGGTHVDSMTADCAAVFDACIVGTGEEPLLTAVADAAAGRLERVYKSPRTFHFGDYPFARRDFLPATSIVNDQHFIQYGGIPGTGAYFSRGCSFSCSFCVYNNPERFELRRPDQITEEIRYLKSNYGVRGINLRDEVCIPVNRKEAIAQLEAMGAEDIIWRGQTVPLGAEDIVALARQSGCVELAIGLESVESDRVLELSNKPSKSVAANRKFIDVLKKHGIKIKVCLIFGLPGETKDVLSKTIQFLEDTQPDYVALSGLDPIPGSAFYAQRERFGIKDIDGELSRHAHLMYRFGDDEEIGLPFEYETETPWGKSLTRQEIAENMKALQHYLRERGMVY